MPDAAAVETIRAGILAVMEVQAALNLAKLAVDAAPPSGPFIPPALEQAFNTLVDAGLGPRQMRVVEALLDRAIGEIIAEALHRRPADLAVLMRWLSHLRIESSSPASLMGGAQE